MHSPVKTLMLLVLSLAVHSYAPCFAQEEPKPEEPKLIKVLRLQHGNARDIAGAIVDLLGGESPNLTAEQSTNSILVRGTRVQLDIVQDLAKELDIPFEAGAKPEKEKAAVVLRVFELKYAEASAASRSLEQILSSYNLPVRVTPDQRLNRIFVSADETVMEQVEAVISTIDVQSSGDASKIVALSGNDARDRTLAQLMHGVAKETGVKLDIAPDMELAVVRGKKESVDDFALRYDTLLESVQAKSNAVSAAAKPEDYIVSVAWLISDEKPSQIPARYRPIAARAAEFGIDNLRLVSQMLSRLSVGTTSAEFSVTGRAVEGGAYLVSSSGWVSNTSEPGVLLLNLELNVEDRANEPQYVSSAEVQMRLVPGQPSIIAATPIDGKQCLFAIEISKD